MIGGVSGLARRFLVMPRGKNRLAASGRGVK